MAVACSFFTFVTVLVSSVTLFKLSLFSVRRECQRVTVQGMRNTARGRVLLLLLGGCVVVLTVSFLVTVSVSC